MTDDKLRESCERVAKAWLGWGVRRWQDGDFDAGDHYMEIVNGEWFAVSTPYEGPSAFVTPENMTYLLASPWGMDLLLDAVEKAGYDIDYVSFRSSTGRMHRFSIQGVSSAKVDGTARHENRYAALIFALDKVEVLDAER